jgi:hypothetical protein
MNGYIFKRYTEKSIIGISWAISCMAESMYFKACNKLFYKQKPVDSTLFFLYLEDILIYICSNSHFVPTLLYVLLTLVMEHLFV